MSSGRPGPIAIIKDVLACVRDARVKARVELAPTEAPVGPLTLRLAGEVVLVLDLVVEDGAINFSRSILSIEPELKPLPGLSIEGLGIGEEGTIQIRLRGREPIDFHRWFRQIPRIPRQLSALGSWLLPDVSEAPAAEPSGEQKRPSFGIRPKLDAITLAVPSLTLRPESSLDLGRGRIALQEISELELTAVQGRTLRASAKFRSGEAELEAGKVGLEIETLTTRITAEADLDAGAWKVAALELEGLVSELRVGSSVQLTQSKVSAARIDFAWTSGDRQSLRWSVSDTTVSAVSVAPPT